MMTDDTDIRFGIGDDFEALEKRPPQKLNIWGRKLKRAKGTWRQRQRQMRIADYRRRMKWKAGQDAD
jgi:hypothetical protein